MISATILFQAEIGKKIKQILSNSPEAELLLCASSLSSKNDRILKNKQRKKCISIRQIIRLIMMKMKMKMK